MQVDVEELLARDGVEAGAARSTERTGSTGSTCVLRMSPLPLATQRFERSQTRAGRSD